MDFTHRLAVSYYKTIAVINESHKIYLVQHQETNKIYVKKILDIYNIDIYKYLYANPVVGTPRIIDYAEDQNKLILIEEFISGSSLLDKMEKRNLSINDIFDYLQDLCCILERLHNHRPSIVHRDIKPSNIIITSYNRAVLLDFNAAKYYSDHSSEDTVLLGTQGYAAPEQYGFGSSSPQTDIYSLGILFREMLGAISFSSARTDLIIRKCTQLNPSERYRSIQELRADLPVPEKPEKKKASTTFHKLIPPGFRTRTPWKMYLASLGYFFIIWASLSLDVKNTYGAALWFQRIMFFIIMLFIVSGHCNYLNIQKLMPLCQSKHRIVRYLGIILLNISVVFGLMIFLTLFENICFPS